MMLELSRAEADIQPVRFPFKKPVQIDSSAPDYILLSEGYPTQAFFIHVMYELTVVGRTG